jgi:hypothetical protein
VWATVARVTLCNPLCPCVWRVFFPCRVQLCAEMEPLTTTFRHAGPLVSAAHTPWVVLLLHLCRWGVRCGLGALEYVLLQALCLALNVRRVLSRLALILRVCDQTPRSPHRPARLLPQRTLPRDRCVPLNAAGFPHQDSVSYVSLCCAVCRVPCIATQSLLTSCTTRVSRMCAHFTTPSSAYRVDPVPFL